MISACSHSRAESPPRSQTNGHGQETPKRQYRYRSQLVTPALRWFHRNVSCLHYKIGARVVLNPKGG